MRRLFQSVAALGLLGVTGTAWAAPQWFTITFTGADMFNYTSGVASLASQDAPRRHRDWFDTSTSSTIESEAWSDKDLNANNVNDFEDWASGNLSNFKFAYFNLYGGTIAPSYWDQPYHAVPNNGSNNFGADSWRNVMVDGVAVINSMGDPNGWAGGIVLANQSYNGTNYAFPVWRAPTQTTISASQFAALRFSVDVLMENYDTAFEPDGRLRVWFGGFNAPQDALGAYQEVSGIMTLGTPVPEPFTVALGLLGLGVAGVRKLRKK